ncbi:MAG: hypothetical protein Q9163_005053, partial [Psora crenata]
MTDLMDAVRAMSSLPTRNYTTRLHNKARMNPRAEELRDYISEYPKWPPDDPDPNSFYMDGVNIPELLERFSDSTLVGALDNVDDYRDKYDFASSVNPANAKQNFLKAITRLTSYCYGEHINRTLRERRMPDLRELSRKSGFPDYMKETLLSDRFIRANILTDLLRGDHVFGLVMLYILDYMRHGPHDMPAHDNDYWNRPSQDVVGSWSWIIWESTAANSESRTDDLVQFCGKLSTLSMLPVKLNETPRPQPLFTSISTLYDQITNETWLKNIKKPASMTTPYVQEIQRSIDRLEVYQNIVNQWESDGNIMRNTWQGTAFPSWQNAMGQALAHQYTVPADNNTVIFTGRPVHQWLTNGWAGEQYFNDPNWWRMFMSFPPDNQEYVDNGSCFRPGTQITLNNGTTAIENVKEWDRVLTLAEPEQYGIVSDETVTHNIEVPLIGFSKTAYAFKSCETIVLTSLGTDSETPFATPAHVFYTTTGLRAVDPDAAMRENPWAKIGHLSVGHVLYRLREGTGRAYDTQEIRSISKTSATLRTVHGIHLRE